MKEPNLKDKLLPGQDGGAHEVNVRRRRFQAVFQGRKTDSSSKNSKNDKLEIEIIMAEEILSLHFSSFCELKHFLTSFTHLQSQRRSESRTTEIRIKIVTDDTLADTDEQDPHRYVMGHL